MFKAPDNADASEGIAGLAWCANGIVIVPSADEARLPLVSAASEPAIIDDYAARTFTTSALVKVRFKKGSGNPARWFCGMPIEVGGKRWGVLVIDSVNEDVDASTVKHAVPLAVAGLSALLRGLKP